MAQLAIKGHTTRGREVIELLEMLGGKNINNLKGENQHLVYIIKNSYGKDIHCSWEIPCGYMVFTLEKFLEKFPYKVGDKVQHKGATSCGSVFEIEKMRWMDNHVEYTIKRLWYNNCHTTVKVEDLQTYKEETMEETMEEKDEKIVDHVFSTDVISFDIAQKDKYELDLQGKFEVVLREGKYYVERIKSQYPKTYDECCEVLDILGNINIEGYKEELLLSLQQLLICRDAYWKIAGEEMGLGKPWEQNYHDRCFIIANNKGDIYTYEYHGSNNVILSFPTEEMRDTFYENFKNLIEQCKEFL